MFLVFPLLWIDGNHTFLRAETRCSIQIASFSPSYLDMSDPSLSVGKVGSSSRKSLVITSKVNS